MSTRPGLRTRQIEWSARVPTTAGNANRSRAPELLLVLVSMACIIASASRASVIVESSSSGSALKAGDVVLGWEREAIGSNAVLSGPVETPFDWNRLAIEEIPRGGVRLDVERRGQRRWIPAPIDGSGLQVRPLAATERPSFDRLLDCVDEGDVDTATAAVGVSVASTRAWVFLRLGTAMATQHRFDEAHGAFALAWSVDRDEEERVAADVLEAEAQTYLDQGRLPEAGALYAESRSRRADSGRTNLGEAHALNKLGTVAWHEGKLDTAEQAFRRSLEIRRALAPESLACASSLTNVGAVAWARGDVDAAETYFEESLRLRRLLAPDGLDVAGSFTNLSALALSRGDLARAEEMARQSLVLTERLAPDSVDVALGLTNLAGVFVERGDLAQAELAFRRAYSIQRDRAPRSLDVAGALANLAIILKRRGQYAEAESLASRALALTLEVAPGSLVEANSQNLIGTLLLEEGNVASASAYLDRALEIQGRRSLQADLTSIITANRALVARKLGRFEEALSFYCDALNLELRNKPLGPQLGNVFLEIGLLARERRDLETARSLIGFSLAIRQALSPGSLAEAESLLEFGRTERQRMSNATAALALCQAVEALAAQANRIGGSSEGQASFASVAVETFEEAIDLAAEAGSVEEVFDLIERSRAQSFLALISERGLGRHSRRSLTVSALRELATSYDELQAQIASLPPDTPLARRRELVDRLIDLDLKRRLLRQQDSDTDDRASGRLQTGVISIARVQSSLPAGAAILAYSIGKNRSWLVSITRDSRAIQPIPIGREQLRRRVRLFRAAIQDGRSLDPRGIDLGRGLTDLLLKPFFDTTKAVQEIGIIADDALHLLPWAALPQPGNDAGAYDPVVKLLRLHRLPSASVYHHWLAAAKRPIGGNIIAFGNPTYGPNSRAIRAQLDLPPLPSSHDELRAIAAVFGKGARVLEGDQATETAVRQLAGDAAILHFACHGVVDEFRPLDSALALSTPAGDDAENGFLQAWEVVDELTLGAELVTLSACETALGRSYGGEGIVGLTRAFQLAGAKGVLASLWNVADASTADLMRHFYLQLADGVSTAEALRRAQVQLMASGEFSAPFHWAGFELFGDPR